MAIERFTRARDRLVVSNDDARSPFEVCDDIVRAMSDVTTFDACAVMLTDVDTMLPSGGVVLDFDREYCAPFWDNELRDPDFNKFRDLHRAVDPVATLVDATDGELERSPRYTKMYAGLGVTDELRVVFATGSTCRGIGVFVRTEGCFGPVEVDAVRQLTPIAANALRASLGRLTARDVGTTPAVVVLDGDDQVVAITEGGARLLDDLRGHEVDAAGVPGLVRAAAMRARWGRTATSLTTRMVGRSGRWMRAHVAPLQGDPRSVAVTIEPARPDDVVSILVESVGYTPRETDVVIHLARGASVKEIACELSISVHTVRDHIKAIYEKSGVNSRGELVAQLFTDHLLERFHESVVHVDRAAATGA